jgi:CRP-like cAMP-binding protein
MATTVGAPTRTNRLLAAVATRDRGPILKTCEEVELTFGDVLSEPNEPIRHVYFPTTSFISLITPKGASESLEVGLVGNEGVFGITLVLGIDASPLKGLVQGGGLAMRMSVPHFRRASKESASFGRVVNAYLYVLMAQIAQTAACGRFHQIEARLARWILMTHDRAGSDTFPLTHVFLAQMLGVRRAGVTEAAGLVQKRGFIQYRRGTVQVLNRPALEAIACPCYNASNEMYGKHLGAGVKR